MGRELLSVLQTADLLAAPEKAAAFASVLQVASITRPGLSFSQTSPRASSACAYYERLFTTSLTALHQASRWAANAASTAHHKEGCNRCSSKRLAPHERLEITLYAVLHETDTRN